MRESGSFSAGNQAPIHSEKSEVFHGERYVIVVVVASFRRSLGTRGHGTMISVKRTLWSSLHFMPLHAVTLSQKRIR